MKYEISKNGIVREVETGIYIIPERHRNGQISVELVLDGRKNRTTRLSLAKLVLMTFDPLKDDKKHQYVSVNFLNGDTTDCCLLNLEWNFGLYTPIFIPGGNINHYDFVKVPGYPHIEINGIGEILYHRKKVFPYLGKNNYYYVAFYTGSKRDLLGVHLLMALTFLEHPIDTYDLVINHKNGVTTDNSISNLEWATYSENIIHAHSLGLRKENKPIFVMNIKSREISEYYSLSAFCRSNNLEDGTLWNRLRYNRPITSYMGFYVKYKDDERTWPDENFVMGRRTGVAEKVRIFDLKSKEEQIFESISLTAKHIGVEQSSIAYQTKKDKPTPYKGYLVKLARDKEPWPEEYLNTLV